MDFVLLLTESHQGISNSERTCLHLHCREFTPWRMYFREYIVESETQSNVDLEEELVKVVRFVIDFSYNNKRNF
jgi:hypothetical protein